MESKLELISNYDTHKLRLLLAQAYENEEKALEREQKLRKVIARMSELCLSELRMCGACLKASTPESVRSNGPGTSGPCSTRRCVAPTRRGIPS